MRDARGSARRLHARGDCRAVDCDHGGRKLSSLRSGAVRLVPAARWLPYRSEWLSADVLAGLTAAAVVIPQSMAYATIAGLPVQVGLYTAFVPLPVYALLGTSRALSVSTTSTIAALTAVAIQSASPQPPTRPPRSPPRSAC